MPQLIDFYEEFESRRNEFEILAFHRNNRHSFSVLDADMETAKKKYWKGRDLPFPILLDSTGDTIKELGVDSYPTLLLIDPDGNLRRGGGEGLLRRELMKTDPAVVKGLERLKGAKVGAFASTCRSIAGKNDEASAWTLMLYAMEKDVPEKHLLAIVPQLARSKSKTANGALLSSIGLHNESPKVRLAAVKALKKIGRDDDPWFGHDLRKRLEKEDDPKVKKALEKYLEALAKKHRKKK